MESKVLMIIKKMFFEFIIIIFLIGFFSTSFANYTVPKVNSAWAYSGNIEKSFSIEGQVEYKEIHKVRLGYNVIIEENFVDVGKKVRQGDPIFRINGNYGNDDINKQLNMLEIELEKENNKIQRLTGSNYLIDEKKLDLQRSNLQKEEKNLAKFKKLYEEGAIPLDELEEYEYKVEALKTNLYIEELKYQDAQR